MGWKLWLLLSSLCLQTLAVHSTWRFLSQLSLHAVGRAVMCDGIPGLLDQQRKLCRKYPEVVRSIGRGVQIGVKECQYQFRSHRWNCTAIDSRNPSLFGKLSLKGSKEVAFVYAISSAGVVFAITKACTSGELTNCACDPTKRGAGQDDKGEFQWTGCSDNVVYGSKFSKAFIDAKEKTTRDARGLMNLHNNNVGRKVVEKFVKLKCKCQGVSGSCSLRTCWQAMQDFHRMGDHIKLKYNAAVRATIAQDGTSLSTVSDREQLSKEDLVYLDKSPDYCLMDPKTGAAGTAGRVCNRTSTGPDGCEQMCCGRGYNTRTTQVTNNCGCKFRWCCDVKCKQCTEVTDVHTCKETPR